MTGNITRTLQDAIKRYQENDWPDNWDHRRFGVSQSRGLFSFTRDCVKTVLEFMSLRQNKALAITLANEADLQWLYERFQDEESRQILIDVLAYRVLGHRKVKLPLNTPDYWKKLEELESRADATDPIDLGFLGWSLVRHDLADEGYPIQVYARAPAVFTQMLLQQYRCVAPHVVIEVEDGDTVIDAGGCYGDTALYFAHKAGVGGRVFSCEFMSDNIDIFRRNLALNPELAKRIEIVPNPLWSSSGQKLYIEGVGPGANITRNPKGSDAKQVVTLKIDDLAGSRSLIRVDFIKMDIEGAELEALKGAEETLRRHRPKLAISVYHSLSDFWTITQWLDGLDLGYRFYLRHFTIHAEETVLFAAASR